MDNRHINHTNGAYDGNNHKKKVLKQTIKASRRILAVLMGILFIHLYIYSLNNPHHFMYEQENAFNPPKTAIPYLNCNPDDIVKAKNTIIEDVSPLASPKIIASFGFPFINRKNCLVENLPVGIENMYVRKIYPVYYYITINQTWLIIFFVLWILWDERHKIINFIKKLKHYT